MKAVRDLHGPRRATTDAIGVGAGAVTRHDLDPGMIPQPARKGLRLAVGQESHWLPPFQVHQHGAVAVALAPSPVVDPSTDGVAMGGRGAARISRSSVLRAVGMASHRLRRAPANPPSARPRAVRRAASRAVLRAQGATTPGSRSVKMRRVQRALPQNSLRTPSRSLTA